MYCLSVLWNGRMLISKKVLVYIECIGLFGIFDVCIKLIFVVYFFSYWWWGVNDNFIICEVRKEVCFCEWMNYKFCFGVICYVVEGFFCVSVKIYVGKRYKFGGLIGIEWSKEYFLLIFGNIMCCLYFFLVYL